MNKYNGLLSSVAHKYHICKGARETENDWKTRLVYSILSPIHISEPTRLALI